MAAYPDYSQQLTEIFGWPDELGYMIPALSLASNFIAIGTNPPYASTDFLAMYPQFTNVPIAVINSYINLASLSLSAQRYYEMWPLAMGYYVAHYVTLWAQGAAAGAESTVSQVASAGLALGIKTSKSAGDVSVGITPLDAGSASWGAFNLTLYGQLLISIARGLSSAPMLCY